MSGSAALGRDDDVILARLTEDQRHGELPAGLAAHGGQQQRRDHSLAAAQAGVP